MQLKKSLSGVFKPLSMLISTPILQKIATPTRILPFYHLVSDESPPHIAHLYPIKTTKAFEKDLDYLLKYYQAVDYFEFRAIVSEEKTAKKPVFLLSFDDGLREFGEVAAPILLQKGVPAINFLNTAFIDNKALFFRYKISLLVDFLLKNPLVIADDSLFAALTTMPSTALVYTPVTTALLHKQPRATQTRLQKSIAALLQLKYHDTEKIDTFAQKIGCDFEAYLLHKKPYLFTHEIQKLEAQGFQFGAHSIDHPEYRFLPLAEQLRQTRLSTDAVQKIVGLDYRLFSFPFTDFGVSAHFFHTLAAEYIADATFGCAGQKLEAFPQHFQRIPFEQGNATAKAILHQELLAFCVKKIIGKHRISRESDSDFRE